MKQWKKVSFKITACILTLQFIVLAVLYLFVNRTISGNIHNNTIDSMQTIVDDRSQIIQNYVHETEADLTAYSRAGEIRDLLSNPTDPGCGTGIYGTFQRGYRESGRNLCQRMEYACAGAYERGGCGNHYKRGRIT